MDYMIIVRSLLVIFGMIAVGFAAGKARLVSDRASADFTSFMMNVTLPCMIFMSMIREFEMRMLRDSLIGLILCAALILLTLAGCHLLANLLHISRYRKGTWIMSTTFGNSGFMGFPLILAIFGQDGLFLAAIMGISYLSIQYTLCVRMMCRFSGAEGENVQWRKIILSPANIAMALGLIFFVAQFSLPDPVTQVVQGFANITTPLSMFLIGLSLSGGNLMRVFRDRDIITCSITRLIIVPLLTALILRILPLPADSLLPGVILLSFAMPCPSLGMIFSQQYGGDVPMASGAIFLSSLGCLVSVPLIMLLL